MNEIDQAKLLKAALQLARREIDNVRVEFEEQLLEFTRTTITEGVQGPPGPPGPKGDPGPDRVVTIESKGPIGDRGEKGDDGRAVEKAYIAEDNLFIQFNDGEEVSVGRVVGPRGGQGIPGERGPIGEQGQVGPRGEKGERGDVGPRGEKGDKGDIGERGPIGPIGPQGIKGDKGDTGDRGEQGLQGEKGDKGDRGERGERGPQGNQGEAGPEGPAGRDGTQVDSDEIRKSLEDNLKSFKTEIESQVSRAKMQAMGSGGGGAVQIREMSDVDRVSALNDDFFLKYDATTGKFVGNTVTTSITIQEEGVDVTSATTLNFVGATITASNTGVNVVNINSNPEATFASNAAFQSALANTNSAIADRFESANLSVTADASTITTTQQDVDLEDEALVNPAGFITINIGGVDYKLPYFS